MPRRACRAVALVLLLGSAGLAQEADVRVFEKEPPVLTDSETDSTSADFEDEIRPASFFQPQSFVPTAPPRMEARPTAPNDRVPRTDLDRNNSRSGLRTSRIGDARQRQGPIVGYSVNPSDAPLRASTDAGNHVGKTPAAPPVWSQQRNPIVTDPRISGSRVGRVAGSGSHWVPARIDLDTMLNKLDSRIVGDVKVIPGPYSVRNGPDFQYFQVDLLPSPRADSLQYGGSSGFEFKSNGEQWLGRQSVYGADEDWGFRLGYNHRTGNDYHTGQGNLIESSYNSRAVDFSLGRDLSPDEHVEVHVLRLDQTDVELPGQAFDIAALVTNGYEVEYLLEDGVTFDQASLCVWYNDTNLHGDSQHPGKRRTITFLNEINDFIGITSVSSYSTGYRLEGVTELGAAGTLTIGSDLRLIGQKLDEFTSGQTGNKSFSGNSPIPRSISVNPGLFAQYAADWTESFHVTAGSRLDVVSTQVLADQAALGELGVIEPKQTLAGILGTSDFNQEFYLGSAFLVGEHRPNEHWTNFVGLGVAQRPPTLTELYAAQPFLFLLQNGLNAVTGDPTLSPERLWQIDVGTKWNFDRCRGSVRGFHSWINDYITFRGDPGKVIVGGSFTQLDLHYINTRLATLAGVELQSEYDVSDMLTGFATLAYVEGHNRTSLSGRDEPLPMIPPFKSRLGGRIHQAGTNPKWGLELSAIVVSAQNRVATSLLENQTPGYTTFDARAFWEPTPKLTIFSGFENFANKTYREHFDYKANGGQVQQPGLNFYVGAETRY